MIHPGASSSVNILDENILDSQRLLIKSWRVLVRQIGYNRVG